MFTGEIDEEEQQENQDEGDAMETEEKAKR